MALRKKKLLLQEKREMGEGKERRERKEEEGKVRERKGRTRGNARPKEEGKGEE